MSFPGSTLCSFTDTAHIFLSPKAIITSLQRARIHICFKGHTRNTHSATCAALTGALRVERYGWDDAGERSMVPGVPDWAGQLRLDTDREEARHGRLENIHSDSAGPPPAQPPGGPAASSNRHGFGESGEKVGMNKRRASDTIQIQDCVSELLRIYGIPSRTRGRRRGEEKTGLCAVIGGLLSIGRLHSLCGGGLE